MKCKVILVLRKRRDNILSLMKPILITGPTRKETDRIGKKRELIKRIDIKTAIRTNQIDTLKDKFYDVSSILW
jgi:hypothetical protein